jgi:hypothetical protein
MTKTATRTKIPTVIDFVAKKLALQDNCRALDNARLMQGKPGDGRPAGTQPNHKRFSQILNPRMTLGKFKRAAQMALQLLSDDARIRISLRSEQGYYQGEMDCLCVVDDTIYIDGALIDAPLPSPMTDPERFREKRPPHIVD